MTTGRKPIIRNAKLHHLKRTVVERQQLGPREVPHARWKADLGRVGGAAVVAGVIATSAAAQAAPRDPELGADAVVPATPAAEVAIAPQPESLGPIAPHIGPSGGPTRHDGYDAIALSARKVSDLKENPYVAQAGAREVKKPRIVRKPRVVEPAYARVDDLKANPYE